jgi:hypothetical protein
MIKWAASWQNQRYTFATSMDLDQSVHPRILIRIHTVRYQSFSTCNRVCKRTACILIRLQRCTDWSRSMLVRKRITLVLSWRGSNGSLDGSLNIKHRIFSWIFIQICSHIEKNSCQIAKILLDVWIFVSSCT